MRMSSSQWTFVLRRSHVRLAALLALVVTLSAVDARVGQRRTGHEADRPPSEDASRPASSRWRAAGATPRPAPISPPAGARGFGCPAPPAFDALHGAEGVAPPVVLSPAMLERSRRRNEAGGGGNARRGDWTLLRRVVARPSTDAIPWWCGGVVTQTSFDPYFNVFKKTRVLGI